MAGARMLIELDDDLLLCSVFSLLSPPELATVAQASKRLHRMASSDQIWLRKLLDVYDVRIRVTQGLDIRRMFLNTLRCPIRPLRYRGYLTNGGVQDHNVDQYWVGNLFTSALWESYSSHHSASANVDCIALSLPSDEWQAAESDAEHQRVLTIECFLHSPFAISADFQNNLPLIPSESLFDLFLELFENYGTTIFQYNVGLDGDDGGEAAQQWAQRVQDLAASLQPARAAGARLREAEFAVAVERRIADNMLQLFDSHVLSAPRTLTPQMGALLQRTHTSFRRVVLNRHGHCSCPVQRGIVFASDALVDWDDLASLNKFDWSCLDSEMAVMRAAEAGHVPPIVQQTSLPNGTFVEFAPAASMRAASALRPVVWFAMRSQAETYAMEEFRARPKLEADKLTMDLLRWHGGNFVDCKLLSSENRMREFCWDDHPQPNIDCAFIGMQGVTVTEVRRAAP